MAVERFSNNAQTTLAAAITTGAQTAITVASATGFPAIAGPPAGQFRILIDSEIMLVTAVSGGNWTVQRAVEPVAGVTAAATHANGATVTHILTQAALAAIAQGGVFPGDMALVGTQNSEVGSPVPGTSNFKIQTGTTVATTDVVGVIAIVFPVPFPNGLAALITSPGDNGRNMITMPIATSATVNGQSVSCNVSNTGVGIVSAAVRVNWIAIGF